jgi:Gpi18-like mannosyltransferase
MRVIANWTTTLKDFFKKFPWLFFAISTLAYLVVFFIFIKRSNLDLIDFMNWRQEFVSGGFAALKGDFYNYAPTYMYLLALSALFPVDSVIAIKLLTLPMVPLAGYFMARMIYATCQDGFKSWLAYTLTVLTPTIVINAAFWGQADVFYGTAVLACLSYLVQKKPYAAMIAFGVAFAFKAPAVFLGPFLFLMLIKKQLPWKSILLPPLVFLLLGLPAFLVGKPFDDIVFVYFKQSDWYKSLCMNCATIWAFYPPHYTDVDYFLGVKIGNVLTGAAALFYLVSSYFRVKVNNKKHLIAAAVLSVALCPFFLAKMHDRYFYLAELLSIGLVFLDWRYLVVPVLLQISATNLYWLFLRQHGYIYPYEGSAVIMLVVFGLLVWIFWRTTVNQGEPQTPT